MLFGYYATEKQRKRRLLVEQKSFKKRKMDVVFYLMVSDGLEKSPIFRSRSRHCLLQAKAMSMEKSIAPALAVILPSARKNIQREYDAFRDLIEEGNNGNV